jgi:hypothetical protein
VRDETKPIVFGLFAWLALALTAGLAGSFQNVSAAGVAVTVWSLTLLTLLVSWKVRLLREAVTALDLRGLIALHLARFVGIYFLILASRGQLPLGFARPAGFGDILVALGAAALLTMPLLRSSRGFLFAWNALGLLDIVFVVSSALRFGLRDWPSMAPLREFPLSLLPTFLVPLIIASHVLIFVRLHKL